LRQYEAVYPPGHPQVGRAHYNLASVENDPPSTGPAPEGAAGRPDPV
jgi:hypothetical protein